jgi:hypothetical protein
MRKFQSTIGDLTPHPGPLPVEGRGRRILGALPRILGMGIAFAIGCGLALGLVAVIGWANLLRGWLVLALMIVVAILWGMHGETESGEGGKTEHPRSNIQHPTSNVERSTCRGHVPSLEEVRGR